jgi:NADPH:quinone reductase-like Zn-dependent oxidoreductase
VGVDFAGEVSEVGSGVSELAVGARVVGGTNFSRKQLGSYADEVGAPDQYAVLLRASTSSAACLSPPSPVDLTDGHEDRAGDRVLVLGPQCRR